MSWATGLSRLATLAAVITLVGLLPWLSGRDPALALLRARSSEQEPSAEALAAIRQSLGLEQGPWVFLGQWLAGLLQGDGGRSWVSARPVLPGMLEATGVSLALMACALLVAATLTAAFCLPALRRGLRGELARSSGVLAATLTALPEFLLAALLLIVGAVWLGWFPPYGWRGLEYAVLPALALGIPAGGLLGRLCSDAVAATFSERWVATWMVAGFSPARIALAVLRRCLPGLMAQIGLVLVSLTGGAIAVEQVFAIPGLGRATLGAAAAQDLPALQTGILLLLLIACGIGIAVGLLRRALLGRAMALGALPTPRVEHGPNPRRWWLPLLIATLLGALILCGLPREPFAAQHPRLAPPGWSLPLGADATGRDLLARLSHGALATVTTALAVTLACLLLGLLIGMAPRLCAGPIEVTNAAPPIVSGLVVAAISGPSALGAAVAVTLVSWAPLAAHTAALASEIRAQAHVRIVPVLGVGRARVLIRYVLPALIGPLFRHAMLRLPGIALALAALGFLGLGSQPPAADWGLLLAGAMPYVERAPWAVLMPALALALLAVLAVSLADASTQGAAARRPRQRKAT